MSQEYRPGVSRGNGGGNGGGSGAPAGDDVANIIQHQLGRPARGVADIAVWCPHGAPAVVQTRPYLEDGEPFPTTFYLTCPSAKSAAAELEAAGGVGRLRIEAAQDVELSGALEWLREWYRVERRRLAPAGPHCDDGAVLEAGIGGPVDATSATCLHAYAAALVAALANTLDASEPVREQWVQLLERYGDIWCHDARCLEGGPRLRRRAAIDVGTNSVRLLVADIATTTALMPSEYSTSPVPVVRRARVTRLGEGLVCDNHLTAAAIARTEAAVEQYVKEARALGASVVTIVGTSATRTAVDGSEFVKRLGERLGVVAGVVTGETEARLAFFGATMDVPGDITFVDVGGGSTELVRWGNDDDLVSHSLNLGCVRYTERFLHTDPPSSDQLRRLREHVDSVLAALVEVFSGADTLVAGGGTATTLAALNLGLQRYNPDAVHHTMLSREQIRREIDRLIALSAAD